MAVYIEGRRLSEAEPFGLLTEGAAGIAAIVLAVIALAGVSAGPLAAIVTIVIGVALIVQAFNAAAEASKGLGVGGAAMAGETGALGGEVLIDLGAGVAGIVLGILGLVGVNAPHLIPAALIVFGGSLILSGAMSATAGTPVAVATSTTTGVESGRMVQRSTGAMAGLEILVGFAGAILGILSLIFMASWVLVLVGFIAIGTALLMVSASFSGAVLRLFTAAA